MPKAKSQLRLDMGEEKWKEYQAELKRKRTQEARRAIIAKSKPIISSKQCFFCKQVLDISNFHVRPANRDGFDSRCITCQRAYYRDYIKHHQVSKAGQDRNRKAAWLVEYKSKLSCCKCGENHPACLHFHHRDKSTKSFSISDSIRRFSLEKIIAEIAKCDVLCANCHAKLHYDERVMGV